MTAWSHTALIIVAPDLVEAANQLTFALTGNEADLGTFGRVWCGSAGVAQYCVAHSAFRGDTVAALRAGVFPPGAAALADVLSIDPPALDPGRICAWVDVDPLACLAALGLAPVHVDP